MSSSNKRETASEALSIVLGLASVLLVLCIRFPALFTTELAREFASERVLRVATSVVTVASLVVGGLVLQRRRSLRSALGLLLVLASLLLGGPTAPRLLRPGALLSADWLVLDGLLLVAFFIPIERRLASQRTMRAGWKVDAAYFISNHLLAQSFIVLGAAVGHFLFHSIRLEATSQLPLALQVLGLLLVADLFQYWLHRAMHELPALWAIHAVHHSADELDALAGSRVHLAETLLTRTVLASMFYLLGFTLPAILLFGALIAVQATLLHVRGRLSYGWLDRVIVSPKFHHWHHSSDREALDTNYAGTFAFLDRVFGSYHLPEGRWPVRYGGLKEVVPSSYWGQFFSPLTHR